MMAPIPEDIALEAISDQASALYMWPGKEEKVAILLYSKRRKGMP